MSSDICKVNKCISKPKALGLCNKHWYRMYRYGDVNFTAKPYQINKKPDVRTRFFKKIEIITESGCWIWMGTLNNNGYGVISRDGKNVSVHRVSWELHNSKIPKGDGYHGICVLHSCDVPCCVNPNHLFIGTHSDNMKDKVYKGRQYNGRGLK